MSFNLKHFDNHFVNSVMINKSLITKRKGMLLYLISIVFIVVGTLIKIMYRASFADIFLGIGMVTFFIAVGMMLYRFGKAKASH